MTGDMVVQSPWDATASVRLSAAAAEVVCVGIHVSLPANGDDPCFGLEFRPANGGELLKVRLPAREMMHLGKVLIELSEARSWCRNT
jgi:hypothetical protein